MKKSILIFLSAIIAVSLFVSCNGDPGTNVETKINITFDKNGGTGEMAALSVKKGENVKLIANTFTWADHEFKGWNTKADGSGFFYANEATVKFDSDTTLYAQWNQLVTVTFNSNDGSEITSKQVLLYNTETALNANTFTRTGYVFWGWNTMADGSGVDYADQESVALTANLNLYAQWAIDVATNTDYKAVWNAANGTFYTMSSSTSINTRITVTGNVHLYLPDDMTLTASKGITVANTNALTIDGTGTLTATGEENQAGIGGEYVDGKRDAGTITINGGTVTTTGGRRASGIGGSNQGDGGTVVINEGTVSASGGIGGSGIGGGQRNYNSGGYGGVVTINGGTVIAKGIGDDGAGAGIGGGFSGNGGLVTINGGTVTATGAGKTYEPSSSAGIGGGGNSGAGGTVIITGGNVTAKGGVYKHNDSFFGKGIGAGAKSTTNGSLSVSNVTLKYSMNDSTYTAYEGTDYSTRYRYMKAE